MAIYDCCTEVSWMQRLFQEMEIASPCHEEPLISSTIIFTENTAAIPLAKNERMSERNKNISIRIHFYRELIKQGVIYISYVNKKKQPDEMLTKALQTGAFQSISSMVMVNNPT